MADTWFFMENGKQSGPVSAGQLKQLAAAGRVQADSLIWKEGLAEWIPASRVNGLFYASQMPPSPPPPPPIAHAPPPPPSAMPVPTPTGPNEIIFPSSLPVTMGRVAEAINRLGSVTEQNQSQQYVTGRIKFGLQSVKVRVSVVPAGPNQCRVVLQGSSDDVWGAGAKNATRRLMEMLRNLDNPGYKPDRLGIHPLALVGLIIGFVILVIIIMQVIGF